MADEQLKRDSNRVPVTGAVTDDTVQEVRNLRVDSVTGGMITTTKFVDPSGKSKSPSFGGLEGDAVKVITEVGEDIKQVVTQLKINNRILNEVHDLNVNEMDIK